MAARSKIIDLNRSGNDFSQSADETPLETASDIVPDDHFAETLQWDEDPTASRGSWAVVAAATLTAIAVFGWLGFFIWANLGEIQARPTPARASELIAYGAMPLLLIATIWLLAMRSSKREAARFADAARSLRNESYALEERMQRVNGEIALARSFLAENALEIDSIGRISAQRLSEAAQTLVQSLGDADEKAKILEMASNAAVSNLEQLRNHLPVVSSAAKDATNQIGIAGNSAHTQIQNILETLAQVKERMASANDVMMVLDKRLGNSAESFETRLTSVATRLQDSVENARLSAVPMFDRFDNRIGDIETRITAASQKIDDALAGSGERLSAIMEAMQTAVERLGATVEQQDDATQTAVARLSALLDQSRQDLAAIDDDSTDRIAKLAFAVSALVERNSELSSALAGTRTNASELTEATEKLQNLLSDVMKQAGEDAPTAVANIRDQLDAGRNELALLNAEIGTADKGSAMLIEQIASIEPVIASQRKEVEALSATTDEAVGLRHEQIDALSAALTHSRSIVDELVSTANEQLVASLLRVRESTRQAAESSRKIVEDELEQIAGSISEKNRMALEAAVAQQIEAVDAAMREAVERNLALSENVDDKIAGQMAKLEEMVSNLEQRIEKAHDDFAGLDDEGFARRMALLTESLNSAAIDVAKILSNEVTDTAWAAYLKGDRGVFTRRAVRLLDGGEAKIIASHYDDDAEFRENVNRYIHDFEAMMRVLLSTRDGNAIGVTMLSSDVGKLYVALAQAIERLRS